MECTLTSELARRKAFAAYACNTNERRIIDTLESRGAPNDIDNS